MAVAGQGLMARSPPHLAYHNSFGQYPGNQLYVGNVSVPCHIIIGADGQPKGTGTVIFETLNDAQQAISAQSFI